MINLRNVSLWSNSQQIRLDLVMAQCCWTNTRCMKILGCKYARTMLPGFCPCPANLIISLQFWKTYTGCLLSKESNTRCCCSLTKLCMAKPLHISPSWCLCMLQPGPCDQRPKISFDYQVAVWKVLVDIALRMPLHLFGTLSLHLLNKPLSLMPSRAACRLAYLMWHFPRSTDCYIVWVYCLWFFLVFSIYKHFWAWWLLTIFSISTI